MKKILALLGTLSMVASSAATVIACTNEESSVKEPEVDLRSKITSDVENTYLGDFSTLPTSHELLTRMYKENPKINWDEVMVEETIYEEDRPTDGKPVDINSIKYREVKLIANEDSEVYQPSEVIFTYTIGQAEEINKLALEKAKSLIIAENYSLDHKIAHDFIIKQKGQSVLQKDDQNDYDKFFNDKSVTQIRDSNLDLKGSGGRIKNIVDIFFPNGLNIIDIEDAKKLPDELGGILGVKNWEEGISQSGILTKIINNVLTLITTVFSSGNLSGIFSLIPQILGGFEILSDAIGDIQKGFNEFMENSLPKETLEPILDGLITGTDLTRFNDVTVDRLYAIVIFSIINALGYALEDNYNEIDVIAQSRAINKKFESSANYIVNSDFSSFDFGRNPAKIIENILTAVTSLNTVLSFYRTSEIDFNSIPVGKKTPETPEKESNESKEIKSRSEYLFSDELTNNEFVEKNAKLLVKDLGLNLQGLNIAELLTNIRYYFSGSEHHSQKLLYVLLLSSQRGGIVGSPLYEFLFTLLNKKMPEIPTLVGSLLVSNALLQLLNNQKLKIDKLLNMDLIWKGIANIPGIRDAIKNRLPEDQQENGPEEVRAAIIHAQEEILGEKSFTFIYSDGDLRRILELPDLKKILPKSISDTINDLFGEKQANLSNLLKEVSLGKLLTLFGVKGINNDPNIPNYLNRFTNKSIIELISQITGYFGINGTEKAEELERYRLDFTLVKSIANELLYEANGQDTGLISQIIGVLDKPEKVYELLGFVSIKENNLIIKEDSFLARLLFLVLPAAKEKVNEEKNLVLADISKMKGDIFMWIAKGLAGISEFAYDYYGGYEAEEFLENVVKNSDNAWTNVIISDPVLFDITTELKSSKITIEFDPSLITLKNGSKLSGQKTKYEFVISRKEKTDKFDFTKATKTIVE